MTTNISGSPVRQEARKFLQLAIPLVSAQLAQSLTGLCDTMMMGRLGAATLAAGGLASWTFLAILNAVAGVVMGISPLVAEAYGAGKKTRIEQLTRQGFWLVLLLSIPAMLAIANLDTLMLEWGQAATTVTLANSYLEVILWSCLPALGFAMLRGVLSGLSLARPIMMIVGFGTVFNIIGNYILGFGKLGFPRLELAGLAIASTLSWWGMFIALIIYTFKQPQLSNYRFWQNLQQLKLPIIMELGQTGIPIGMFMTLELGIFTIITYLMGTLGTEVLAAHQVAFQTTMVTFMIPLGMSFATTTRVGQWLGRKDREGIRRAGWIAMAISLAVMSLISIVMLIFPQAIVSVYLDPNDPANTEIFNLAIPLLIIVSLSQILDGIQKIAYGALQGIQDMRIPVLFNILAFYGIGLKGYLMRCQNFCP